MPSAVIIAFLVEAALIVLTTLLLTQPKTIFGKKVDRLRPSFKWGGLVLLCLTFCWSVIVGIVLSMNDLSFRL